jgi:hypothetical protein
MAIDEGALADPEFVDTAFPILRGHPLGSAFNYQTLIATTPTNTSNWIYKRFIENSVPSFIQIKARAEENFIEFSKDKLEYLKDSMTELMYSREYDLQWTSLSTNTMAYAFHDALITDRQDKESGRLFMSCDINNIDLQTVCGWFQKSNWTHIDGEILINTGGNPQKVAQEFHKRYSKVATRQITVGGDRYGSNSSTTSKETYYQQLFKSLKDLGWSIIDHTLQSNPQIWDSNEIFMKLCEKNKFTISPNCKEIIRHLKTCQWMKNEHKMDKKLLDSGFYDSIRYHCWEEQRSPKVASFNL